MARHEIHATQVRVPLSDFIHDRRYPEISHPHWRENERRLRNIVADAAAGGLDLYWHADNFRLAPDQPLFRRKPRLKGAPIFTGVLSSVCTGSDEGLDLIARGWEQVFRAVSGLGGMIAIVGGECFTHRAKGGRADLREDGDAPCLGSGTRAV
jgi:hypothetical protein